MDSGHSRARTQRRACTNCTTAKVRCTPYAQDVCERCERLQKNCIYLSVSERRRKPRDPTRVQRLEERLEELVSHLSNVSDQRQTAHPKSSTPSAILFSRPPSETRSGNGSSQEHTSVPATNVGSSVTLGSATTPDLSFPHNDERDVIDRGILSFDYASTLLDTFRYSYTRHFPFVILPPEATAASLRREKPFLFLSIIAVSAFDNSPLQRLLGKELQKQIAIRIIIRDEKNIDLLQGLLVNIAYYHYFFTKDNQQMYLMVQLALALVHELGLHHSVRPEKNLERAATDLGKLGSAETHGERRAEELRTFLGIFVLSDDIAKVFRKQNLVCDEDFAIHCCQQLMDAKESPTDRWIYYYVQLSILSRRMSDTFCYHDPKLSKVRGEGSICAVVETFKRELHHLERAIDEDDTFRADASLSREVQFLDLWIHEVVLHDVVWQGLDSTNIAAAKPLSLARINMLWHIFTVAKEYTGAFLDLPWAEAFELSFITLHRICYVLIVFCRTVFFYVENKSLFYQCEQSRGSQLGKVRGESTWNAALMGCVDEFHRVGSALQEKFTALVTDQANANGECDAMWHFAIFIKGILTGHERRMKRGNHLAAELAQDSRHENSGNKCGAVKQPSLMAARSLQVPNDLLINGTNTSQSADGMMDPEGVMIPLESDIFSGLDWGQYMTWQTVLEDFVPGPARPW